LRDPASLAAIGQLTTALTKVDGIEKVRSISQPAGEALPQLSLEQQQQMMQSPEFQAALSYYTSQDGMYGKMEIVLEDNPYAEKSLKEIVKIEKAIDLAVKGTALENVQIKLAGTTAAYHELDDISQEDLIRTTTLVVIGTFIVLMVMLRSIVAPIYILLSLVLNYLITMGILEWVFVDWLGNPGLSWTVSFFAFIIIVALGVDYSIFLMARVKEEYTPGNIQAAIRKAMVSTGGVIMSAAAIMSGTFAAMMFSGVLTMMQIGAAIVIGLILYTFLFMGFIVPATVRLLGDKNGWPFKF
jgi:RND superfamily putative drug exporter